MDNADRRRIYAALARAGFTIARHTRHGERWTHPDGRTFAMPTARGDSRHADDQRRELRRMGVEL